MELSVAHQAAQAAAAVLLGAELGLLYDLFRGLRRGAARLAAAVLDVLYTLVSALALFAYAQGVGEGRLRVFMLVSAGAGAMGYFALLSEITAEFMHLTARTAKKAAAPLKKYGAAAKKAKIFIKKTFPKKQIWFTMSSKYRHKWQRLFRARDKGGAGLEVQKGRYIYEDRRCGADPVRGGEHRVRPRPGGGDGAETG